MIKFPRRVNLAYLAAETRTWGCEDCANSLLVFFSMQHIFTHDFILGQFSIVALLVVVITYLKVAERLAERTTPVSQRTHIKLESTEWLNALLHQVCK